MRGVTTMPTEFLPLVSVVIPAYKCASYLAAAIDSALAQTHSPVEVIVVNDGSPDDTDEVVKPYVGRLTYIKQENRGLSAARNAGFRASHGEFICFLDADDVLLPDKITRQLEVFRREPDLGIVISGYVDVEEDGRTVILTVRKPWNRDGLERLLRHEVFPPHAALIRRSVLEASTLFPEDIDTQESQEDWQLWLEMALAGVQFGSYPEPTCLYRQRAGSIRSDVRKHYRGALRVVRWLRGHPLASSHAGDIDALEEHVEMEVAAVALRIGDVAGAADALIDAAQRHPRYWLRPAAYQALFSRSLSLHEAARRPGIIDGLEFEERILDRLLGEVTTRVGGRASARWRSAAFLALAQILVNSGNRSHARRAVRQALSESWAPLQQRETVLLLARSYLSIARSGDGKGDEKTVVGASQ